MRQSPPDALHAVLVTRADLLRHHDPVRVQGYCRTCEKHGRFWSCPPFTVSPLTEFAAWTHAVVVCRRIPLAPGTTKEQMLERFLSSRVGFGELMRGLEARSAAVTALIAGHCSGCAECTRAEDQPCRTPERLRYSLEAVGFDVTALTENLAGIKLHWPQTGIPDYLTTVGALLCPDETVAAGLCASASAGR